MDKFVNTCFSRKIVDTDIEFFQNSSTFITIFDLHKQKGPWYKVGAIGRSAPYRFFENLLE